MGLGREVAHGGLLVHPHGGPLGDGADHHPLHGAVSGDGEGGLRRVHRYRTGDGGVLQRHGALGSAGGDHQVPHGAGDSHVLRGHQHHAGLPVHFNGGAGLVGVARHALVHQRHDAGPVALAQGPQGVVPHAGDIPRLQKGVDHPLRPAGHLAQVAEGGAGGLQGRQTDGPTEGHQHLLAVHGGVGREGAAAGAVEDTRRHALGHGVGVPGIAVHVGEGGKVRLLLQAQQIGQHLGQLGTGHGVVGGEAAVAVAADHTVAAPAGDGGLRPVALGIGELRGPGGDGHACRQGAA